MMLPLLVAQSMDIRHAASLTKGSISNGTTTVTTRHGASDGIFGTYTSNFLYLPGTVLSVFGLIAGQSTGATTVARHSYLDTDQHQFDGSPASVLISLDGGTWYEFLWQERFTGAGVFSYSWRNDQGLGGDPFGFFSMGDGTVTNVLVVVPH